MISKYFMNKRIPVNRIHRNPFFDTKKCNIRLTVIENFAKLMEML